MAFIFLFLFLFLALVVHMCVRACVCVCVLATIHLPYSCVCHMPNKFICSFYLPGIYFSSVKEELVVQDYFIPSISFHLSLVLS